MVAPSNATTIFLKIADKHKDKRAYQTLTLNCILQYITSDRTQWFQNQDFITKKQIELDRMRDVECDSIISFQNVPSLFSPRTRIIYPIQNLTICA